MKRTEASASTQNVQRSGPGGGFFRYRETCRLHGNGSLGGLTCGRKTDCGFWAGRYLRNVHCWQQKDIGIGFAKTSTGHLLCPLRNLLWRLPPWAATFPCVFYWILGVPVDSFLPGEALYDEEGRASGEKGLGIVCRRRSADVPASRSSRRSVMTGILASQYPQRLGPRLECSVCDIPLSIRMDDVPQLKRGQITPATRQDDE